MRGQLILLAGLGIILASACGDSGGSDGGSSTSAGTAGTTGGTGGTTTGGGTGGTSGGTSSGTTGGLAAGATCSGNAQCHSGVCGAKGTGKCCTAACATSDATCGATDCDTAGACIFPATTTSCGADACNNGELAKSACDGSGACKAGTPAPCTGNFACADATSCRTLCNLTVDCQSGFYCDQTSHQCLAPKATGPCTTNEACTSAFCGIAGTGNCCTAQCGAAADPACDPTSCDATSGACVFPSGNACGTSSCTGHTLTAGACDPVGACNSATGPCPNNLVCNTAGTACLATCAATIDCVSGFYCSGNHCLAQVAVGACTTNEACTSGICGIAGTGHCCTAPCDTTDPSCGAKDCDNLGACTFPNNRTACGPPGSCSGTTQTDPTTCDGAGVCQPQGTSDCTPFVCGATACLTTCKDATSCVSGDFCDVTNHSCCSDLTNGSTINVDGATGNDSTPCCGIGSNGACLTLTHAMALIDAAQAQNVTINATVKGGGGDWTAKETYPVTLGWGVELSAPEVFFLDPMGPKGQNNPATFDIAAVSTSDTVGYASIVGNAKSPVSVGMDSANANQTDDNSTIAVETGNALYLANASVNGSSDNGDSEQAILVQPAATLTLGQDQSGSVTGTVTIGNSLGQEATDGWVGIACVADLINSLGCNVQDVDLGGPSSVVIQGQEDVSIDAEDFAVISLTSSPVIGSPPSGAGFKQCPQKVDSQFGSPAVLINGQATVTFSNGIAQCLASTAFLLEDSGNGFGSPTLNMDHTTIQNTELGVFASMGTATLTNSTINFNFGGVQQATDGTNNGTIDLTGGGIGGNTVVCSSTSETAQFNSNPGIDVYNTSTQSLDASNVAWDTSGPDYFDCDPNFTSCTCNLGSCTVTAGSDGMDAVEDSTNKGGVTTTGNTLSSITCN